MDPDATQLAVDSRKPADADALAWFDQAARDGDPFQFAPEDASKLELLRQRLGPLVGMTVVEPGCGAGHLTEWLARWVAPGGRVVAFDPCESMLERARARTRGLVGVELRCGSIESMDLPASACDRIVCFRVWPHFDDGAAAAALCARWLRPQGRLIIAHWKGRKKLDALHGSVPSMATSAFPEPAAWRALLERSGFAVETWIDEEHEIFIDCVRLG